MSHLGIFNVGQHWDSVNNAHMVTGSTPRRGTTTPQIVYQNRERRIPLLGPGAEKSAVPSFRQRISRHGERRAAFFAVLQTVKRDAVGDKSAVGPILQRNTKVGFVGT